jgi:hypothetical protein
MCVVAVFSHFLLLTFLRLPLLFLFSFLRVGVSCVVGWTFFLSLSHSDSQLMQIHMTGISGLEL